MRKDSGLKMSIPDPTKANETVLKDKVHRVVSRFEKEKGELNWKKQKDPLAGLINTLLSQNTNDTNRDRAYDALLQKYPTWKEVHQAPVDELAEVIRPAGLNRQKSQRIHDLLAYLKETEGDYTADFLKTKTFDEAVERLGHLKGIGLKTLAVVMCFDLGVDVFPVDTHVHRLCTRLGFVPGKFDAVKTFLAMRSRVPSGKSFQFHLHLIRYGRETCHARKPECDKCFIKDECFFYYER